MIEQRWEFRAGVLKAFGASGSVVAELLTFNDVARPAFAEGPLFPLPPEPHVETWREYAVEAAERGVWNALRSRLPQLQFPVRAGMSQTEAYQAATRRGEARRFPTAKGRRCARRVSSGSGCENRSPGRSRSFAPPTATISSFWCGR